MKAIGLHKYLPIEQPQSLVDLDIRVQASYRTRSTSSDKVCSNPFGLVGKFQDSVVEYYYKTLLLSLSV